jgi:hypothetical protein
MYFRSQLKNTMHTFRFLFTCIIICLLATIKTNAQYISTENNQIKACFKGYCDTDTLSISGLRKAKSLPLISDNKDVKIVEFTIMLTDIHDEVYVAVINFNYLDRSNLDLLARSYKTLQLTDITAKNDEGHLVKLKPKLYWIKP